MGLTPRYACRSLGIRFRARPLPADADTVVRLEVVSSTGEVVGKISGLTLRRASANLESLAGRTGVTHSAASPPGCSVKGVALAALLPQAPGGRQPSPASPRGPRPHGEVATSQSLRRHVLPTRVDPHGERLAPGATPKKGVDRAAGSSVFWAGSPDDGEHAVRRGRTRLRRAGSLKTR